MIKNRTFDVELATKFGLNNAIFLQDLAFWIEFNRKRDKAFRDGRYWTYSTMEEISERHPYWTKNQVRHIIDTCKKNGWIFVEHYDQSNYNRRNWYSIRDDIMSIISFGHDDFPITECDTEHSEVGNISHRSDLCINSNNIDKKKLNKNMNKEEIEIFAEELFKKFWESYPQKVGKQATIKAWNKIKPDEALLTIMLKTLEEQKKLKKWQDRDYIPYPATWLNGRRWEDEIKVEPENQEKKKDRIVYVDWDDDSQFLN